MRFALTLFLLSVLGLAACSGPADRHYVYEPVENPGGRLCTLQCSKAQNACTQNCDMDQRLCTNQIQTKALEDYEQYVRDQFIAHQPVELHAHDFERLEPCDNTKKSCNIDCQNDFKTCYESCGGKVDVESSCQFFCF